MNFLFNIYFLDNIAKIFYIIMRAFKISSLKIIALGGNMKKVLIILFAICYVYGTNRPLEKTVILSGDKLIKLTSQNVQLELKRKNNITSLKKKDDITAEKRRHKRRRKVRPPKEGK